MPLHRLKVAKHQPAPRKAKGWIELERKLDAWESNWQFGQILNLSGFTTVKFKESDSDIVFLAEMDGTCVCPCGASPDLLIRNGWTAGSTVLDCNLRYKRTSIYFITQRYKCQVCEKVIQPVNESIHERHRLTKRIVEHIQKESLSLYRTFSEISVETGVHEKIIRDIFTDYCVELELNRELYTPIWIAIDEVYPAGRKYPLCVITDPLAKKVIGLLPDNKSATLQKWLLQLPNRSRIKVVSIDMHDPYKFVVEKLLKGASRVVDRYHVHNQLNTALKEVLAIIRETLTKKEQDDYMRPEYLVLKSRFHLSNKKVRNSELSEKESVEAWFVNVPDLSKAYQLKEKFSDILDINDRQTAEEKAKIWLEEVTEFSKYFTTKYAEHCLKCRKYPFRSVIKTFKRWFDEILNYINFKGEYEIKVSNAFAEYANKVIKSAYKRSSGCNFEVLRAKVLNGDFLKGQPSPNPVKKKRKKRGLRNSRKIPAAVVNSHKPSNIIRLRLSHEGKDKTIGLLVSPQNIAGWLPRFRHHIESRPRIVEKPPTCGLFPGTVILPPIAKKRESTLFAKKKKSKSSKQNPDQPSLF